MGSDWKEQLRARLQENISRLDHISEERKAQLLEVECAKAVAESEHFVGLGTIPEEGTLWDIMLIPDLTIDQRRAQLAEEAKRLVEEEIEKNKELNALRQQAYRYTFLDE